MIIERICLVSFYNCIEICVSGIFPETAWRAAHSHQAAHVNLRYSWVPLRNRLAVSPCTARRRTPIAQFLGFVDELPDSDEQPLSDASLIDSVLMF